MFSDYTELEAKIGYSFKEKKLLDGALTHKSYSVERRILYDNERLEFLGDSVVGLIVAEYLVRKFSDRDEGYLSKLKSYLVSSKNLYRWAKKLDLDKYVKLSFGEVQSGGRAKPQISANAFEAIIGAMYLDGAFDESKKLIEKFLIESDFSLALDYKSDIQEYCQKKYKALPYYKIVSQVGPDHEKKFIVSLNINHKEISVGEGKSKKEAEQDAAKKAIEILNISVNNVSNSDDKH
ncbi:MAG: ribonuclease III [Elusimicrobiales bacterium]|jgi:ribonuclease-3|nr:ribonuclease III [Elusimicrobiales bacterium]NLH39721.1 ribonuclease III [Elusimicrobiota bacterium]